MREGSYTHLTFEEREQIAIWRLEGLSQSEMARRLGRSQSAISRELGRNCLPSGGYQPTYAEGSYLARRERRAILENDEQLERFVIDRLTEGWTPEQIAGWLKRGEERGLRSLGTETIYRFIHRSRQQTSKLWKLLPRGKAKRGRRKAHATKSTIPDRQSIHDRPKDVQKREKPGDWEADLIICKRTRPVLVIHDRHSRLTLASKLTGKSAAETVAVMMGIFKRMVPELKNTITFDNGTEFARHAILASVTGMTTWFCDAYASWQKGGIENTNGRLRKHLPRDLDVDSLSEADLQDIVLTHNLTPRKCLDYLTPIQAFLKGLGKDVRISFA
jgi:IS30 family transposase